MAPRAAVAPPETTCQQIQDGDCSEYSRQSRSCSLILHAVLGHLLEEFRFRMHGKLKQRDNEASAKDVMLQAVWEQETCLASLKVNGLYEGSGLALWLRTGIYSTGKGRDVSPGSIPFGEITKFKTDFFGKEVTMKAAVQRGTKKQRTKERILWPIEMVCGCENVNDAKHDHFDGSLNLASCHFVLWSWYLAVFEALKAGET
eukprot:s1300_g12.t1